MQREYGLFTKVMMSDAQLLLVSPESWSRVIYALQSARINDCEEEVDIEILSAKQTGERSFEYDVLLESILPPGCCSGSAFLISSRVVRVTYEEEESGTGKPNITIEALPRRC